MQLLPRAILSEIRGGSNPPTTEGEPDIPQHPGGPEDAAQNQQSAEGDPTEPH